MRAPGKFWQLLRPHQQGSAVVLLGLMLIGMVIETLGIGLVIPTLVVMTQNDLSARYPALVPWLDIVGNPSREALVIYGMLILVAAYGIKAIFLAFLAWRQARFVFRLQADVSQRLFEGYLRQPYTFHLRHNSAQLIRNTIGHVDGFSNVVRHGLFAVTELLVFVGIAVLLLVVEPAGAVLLASTLGLAAWGFNLVTRHHILRWGEARELHEGRRIQHLQQGLGGAKDVKLLGREEDFLAQYRLHNAGSAKVGERHATLMALPRLWLELLAVTGLAALVLVMIGQNQALENLLPTAGLFGVAAFRLMPSITRVLIGIQNVRFFLPVIDTLHRDICLLDADPPADQSELGFPFRETLTLDHVSFRYESAATPALSDISMTVRQGTSVGFIGTTGAGKSTLVDVILGLLTQDAGAVRVDGVDIQTNLRGWQNQIGYVPQSIFLTDDTIRRNVAFGLPIEQIEEAAIKRAVAAAQLDRFVMDLPQGLDTVVGERGIRLSGGQRQRIGIARALYHDPSVLVLDEATSSLDTDTESNVMESVRALHGEKTILIVAHRLSTVKHCDRLFRLDSGRVVEEGEATVEISASS